MKNYLFLLMIILLNTAAAKNGSSINILDTKKLKFKDSRFKEISDIACKNSDLYAISDLGVLFRLKIEIKSNKIADISLIDTKRLKDSSGKKLKKPYNDSEGLSFMKNNLLVSFEKVPRIALYRTDAKFIKKLDINSALNSIDNYTDRNSALEAVAYNEKYKVVTAPQKPLKKDNSEYHSLYIDNSVYKFAATANITAMEFIDKDQLMILEKKHKNSAYEITLSKIDLSTCRDSYCEKKLLNVLKKSENFEGLTKVDENRFLMISDNQNKGETILLLFKLK